MNHASNGMTTLMFQQVAGGELTLEQAVEQLHENAHVRTVRETLSRLTGVENTAALRALLMEKLQSVDPGTARDTLDKRIQGWMKDTLTSIKKESAVPLCFLFGLSVPEANDLLVRLCGMGFHWRSPEDIVYIYGLNNGLSYPEVRSLLDRLSAQGLLDAAGAGENQTHTVMVKSQVDDLSDEEELRDFLRSAQKDLGNYHNTAYMLFENYMNCLEQPDSEEDAMSVDTILMTYLHRAYLPRSERSSGQNPAPEKLALSSIQKGIRENWPDKRLLSNMHTRKTDVTRKALILLFLATDGEWTAFASGDDYLTTADEVFEDVHSRMTDMLNACGFPPLDARVPFDWMILYCMCVNERLLIDGRLQHFLSQLFPSTQLEPELTDVLTSSMKLAHKPER